MIYQATFRQPLEHLNRLGAKLAAPIDVEIFPMNKGQTRWCARYLKANGKTGATIPWQDGNPITHPSAGAVKVIIKKLFAEQVTPWREIPVTEEELKAAQGERAAAAGPAI